MKPTPAIPILRPAGRCGFTLIEAALVTVIMGAGVMASMQLFAAGTSANLEGAELSTGMNLARNVREMSLQLSFADPTTPGHWGLENGESLASGTYDDLDDLDGVTFSPPIDARKQTLTAMAGWSQAITVQSVSPDWLTLDVTKGASSAVRITVVVSHHDQEVCRLSWYAFNAVP